MSGVILVRDVMSSPVRTIRVGDSVRNAVRKMNKFRIGCLVVMQGDRPVGILTERDIMRKVVEPCIDPSLIRVSDVMSTPITTIDPAASVEDAARLMSRKHIKKLPVVEDGRIVGIVTSTDLMRSGPELVSALTDLLSKK
ncbi:MAG: CBS domain-containing protein [Candidatus Bathyarchaeota archaeon]|nr:CBS domain-containing protein [Candidatus Bathyarchaeota archaeon]